MVECEIENQHGDSKNVTDDLTINNVYKWLERFWYRHSANVLATTIFITGLWLSTMTLALANERIPTETKVLPDILFDLLPNINCLIFVEVFIGLQYIGFVVLLLMNPDREIILRRFLFILGITYIARMVTFTSTSLPCPYNPSFCEPKLAENQSLGQLLLRTFRRSFQYIPFSLGFTCFSKQTLCGGYVFSGQSTLIILVYLFINTYFPNKHKYRSLWFVLENIHFALATIAVIGLVISRQDYTVDIVLGYYVATQLFWSYHSLCLEKYMFHELRQRYDEPDENQFTTNNEDGEDDPTCTASITRQVTLTPNRQHSRQVFTIREDQNFISQVWWWSIFVYLEIIKRPPDSSKMNKSEVNKSSSV